MIKRVLIATVAVFLAWSVMDFILHMVVLGETYMKTADLWRTEDEMKLGLMYFVTFATAFGFSLIYGRFFKEKNMNTALQYGVVFGFIFGISMGYGTYSVMPIPYILAFSWFVGMIVEGAVGGLLLGLILKDTG